MSLTKHCKGDGGGGESESYVNLMLNEIQYVGDVCCD